ncbi:Panacea domain-containing protein [Reichenbachiella versicolor]|uniref:Panacea domain-containing protein n=1 Tax=Reichenbachiella versicolor TaxID=1821036 RepID=UPI000D6E2CAA|nr:type II toxin-antitoxin system antitoxin SocA domain-containing protein [Reichenbachiella versicolor]
MFDSVTIAEYMLSLAYEKRIVLNMTKIQKLLYLVYGKFMAESGKQISKESPKAWPYGPVFPRVHKKVKLDNVKTLDDPYFAEISQDKDLNQAIIGVIDRYSKFSATQLSDWSHSKGGPWDRTTKKEGFKWGVTEIPNEYIREYFTKFDLL